jgi:phytoene/squalene synthetase
MSVEACAALVEKGDPDRFLATMTGGPQARERLFPLYAFNLEIARAPWVSPEPMIGQMRLQFWRDTLAEIDAGQPARAHEVAAPLAGVVRETGLPVELLDAMAVARWTDLERAPFAGAEALGPYLDETAGNLMWAAVLALGGGADLEPLARNVGRASGLASWLLAVPELEARGWQALPDDLSEFIAAARSELRAARSQTFGPALPALRAAWRAEGVLARAAADPGAIRAGRLGGSEFARRGSLLVKTLTGRW